MAYQLLDVESHNLPVRQHIRRIARGDYVLPEFQRTFVWDNDKILRLWDSLYHGYPIGQLMLWDWGDTDFPMRSFGREQGALERKGSGWATIDGQQRLTAIYLVLSGDTPLKFDLANERFTYADGPNCLRLDVLRNAVGEAVDFDDAAGSQFFQIHSTEAQRKNFGKTIDHLNGNLESANIALTDDKTSRLWHCDKCIPAFESTGRAAERRPNRNGWNLRALARRISPNLQSAPPNEHRDGL